MRALRWLFFLPLSAFSAVLLGLLLKHSFPDAYFSRSSLWISAGGLAPLFITRLLPIIFFVVLGAALAPQRGRVQITMLGVVGGVFGWPWGPQYSASADGFIFYVTEGLASITGTAIGMIFAFGYFRKQPKAEQKTSYLNGA